jgi:hypothetical protein
MRDSSTEPADHRAADSANSLWWCRFPGSCGLLRVVWFLMILACGSGLAQALEVREVRWGFNGAVKRNAFNLCSIDLHNPAFEAFQGPVQLAATGGVGRGDDTPWTELNFYVESGQTRTVQFVVYVTSQALGWEVSWGPGGQDRFEFPHSKREIIAPVAVQFFADQGVSSPLKGIEVFNDRDFPIGAAGTETLGSVVLDHVPRWDQVRSRAFRDWLGRGGRLYLINGRDGKPLSFPSPLEDLNVPADQFPVGQGVVLRQEIVQDAGQIPGLITEVAQSTVDPNNPYANQNYHTDPATSGMTQLFQTMRNMVRPDHNWGLIFFLAMIYLLILFPGIWLVSRKRGDFRVTYAMILGTVLLFSWFYAEIGKRGYGESTGLREMMIAYPLGNQRVALQKYGSLFVTEGGGYAIPAHGEGAVLTLESGTEFSGNAEIMNRPQALIGADIPPFSACSYQASSVLPTRGDYSFTVKRLELHQGMPKIEVQFGAAMPTSSQVFLVSGGRAYALTHRGTAWVNMDPGLPINSMFPTEYNYGWNRVDTAQDQKNLIAYLVQIATSTDLSPQYGGQPVPPVADSTATAPFGGGQILVYGDAPAEFLPTDYAASGKVLFVSQVDQSMVTVAAP